MKIDFVSDVSCPWCAIGLQSLQQAIGRLHGALDVALTFQPFELNPGMAAEGEDIVEHLADKYGTTPQQIAQSQEAIRVRGEQLGFVFRMDRRGRIYNTFDAHRLLHWAAGEGRQQALKQALFKAYFSDGENPSAHETLVRVAASVGLDGARAAEILASDEYAAAVREREQYYLQRGISSVPSIIIDDQHLIQGGQPVELFEKALRRLGGLV